MTICPACATENPAGARFCNGCGAPLTAPPPALPEERKIVSALFCDLVGFTATSEDADPEDVDRMLTAYFAMARSLIEAHGGVVEKFIGDAVLGVFGVPAAHEDDPERAVRAALRICEDAAGLESLAGQPLRLRVGINTGEVLVRLSVAPGSGERFLAGDTINTASRIQSVAPQMGVAVGLATYEATKQVFEYEELPPASLKGKAEPVRVFHAKAPRARLGVDLTRTHGGPYVGREIDLALLTGLFDKSVAASSVQLVTVVGEPGIGKSRIVAELLAHARSRAPGLTWRQGRCLPYGDGITFWALGEIVKAHTGILDSDGPAVAAAKLDLVLPEGDERAWFRQRLLPLVGIDASSPAEREELFTAWRRFVEHMADQGPTVLVFEDLHWADEAMVAFMEHLVDRAEGVPLLVVGTARPELFDLHPRYAAGMRNATPVNLAPLSDDDTARLIAALLDATDLPADLQRTIKERAGGNPLYAEEFVGYLHDKDLLVQNGSRWQLRDGAAVPIPGSVQALIAARLDTLPPQARAMLADAAVIGKVFWAGAITQMGGFDPTVVDETLRDLARNELVRPARRSSMAGEAEYAFWHVLTRDVAYSRLPRSSRAARHVAAARWIESQASERLEDVADVLAHHYATARGLAEAGGLAGYAAELESPAFRFLSLAGERALGLDAATALSYFEQALVLAPNGHPDRPDALARFAEAAHHAGRTAEAAEALEEAVAGFRAAGNIPAAARAMGRLGIMLSNLGSPRGAQLRFEALALVEPLGPTPALVEALTGVAVTHAVRGESRDAIELADRALALAGDLGLPRPARALAFRGMARVDLGDPGGLEDYREAIAIATEATPGLPVAGLRANFGEALWQFEGPAANVEVRRELIAYVRVRGLNAGVSAYLPGMLLAQVDTGEHDEALRDAADLIHVLGSNALLFALVQVRAVEARILALRGRAVDMAADLDWLENAARGIEEPQLIVVGLGSSAVARASLGQHAIAATLLGELEAYPGARDNLHYYAMLPSMVRAALGIGDLALAERLASGLESRYPYTEHARVAVDAALAEARGDLASAADTYGDAAGRWLRFGVVPEQAFALLGQGRCLVGLSRAREAMTALMQAEETFGRLAAVPALEETSEQLRSAVTRE